MKYLLTRILPICLLLMAVGTLLVATPVFAATKDDVCNGLALTGGGGCDTSASGAASSTVSNTVRLVINIFSLVVGVAAVVMIIIGGLKYITSSGDSSNITGAKNTILYAIVGLVIVILAQVIVRFVLTKAAPPDCTPPLTVQPDGTCK